MKTFLAPVLLLAWTAAAQNPPPAPAADGFGKWWPAFQAAVARRDAKAVGQGMRFPQQWENGPKIREIRSQADLTRRFDRFFTPEIKRQIATKTPERLPSGGYLIVWHARGNEYSLHFIPSGESFALDGLGEGPP
jgi:hypothetical protein